MEEKNIDRRDFLKKSIKAVAIGTLALSALDIKNLLAAVPESFSRSESPAKVINLSDYPDLQSVGGYAMISDKVIVIRTSSSKFVALNITCTHKKCDVDYNGTKFVCDCHGSEFSKTGKVLEGPATKNLKSYKTTYDSDAGTLTINM
jgi:cytochrome b6-f complex iron-sulfur subunit